MKRNGTPTDNIEYSEICKAIRRKMKEDIRKHDEKQIIEAIGNSKSLKQARQKQRLGKGQLVSIMEEDGTHIHDKDRIVKRCVELYEELYKSRRASADQDLHDDRTTTSSIDPPSILRSEVEVSIKRLKRNKAPGEAFDSIEFEPLFEGLKNQGVDEAYLNILWNLYSEATSVLQLHKDSEKFKLGRGARQGDNISPKLFMSCLQHAIINHINWENKGVKIDGEYLFLLMI